MSVTRTTTIRRPHTANPQSLTAAQVAAAYNYPPGTGKGRTIGLIELGGGFSPARFPGVTAVSVAGGKNAPDGPNGADGEVQLDIEVARAVAPNAAIRVYFCPNTDSGFLAGVKQAVAECTEVSISWGGPESSWDTATMRQFDAVFAAARAKGVTTFVAAGDTGADDGTGTPTCDFPASSPNVVSCGGTRLTVNPDGSRASEVTWDDSDTSSATGGGVSRVFPGRQVPDVAGNADPDTGYQVQIDGEDAVIGGTSAVAPLYAALSARIGELHPGGYDFVNTVVTNPSICFDVTAGSNGAYRAGPGRDETTGFGVVDGAKLLAVLSDATPDPVPAPTPTPSPTPAPSPAVTYTITDPVLGAYVATWVQSKRHSGAAGKVAAILRGEAVTLSVKARSKAMAKHYHSAKTGAYVSKATADANPDTTFASDE